MFESLNNSKKHLIGSVDLNGNWQEISQEFNTPRVGYRSFRVLFEFETKQDVFIDDIALVEWRTPYLTNDQQAHFHNGAGQATYIGFESKPKSAIELMIQPR